MLTVFILCNQLWSLKFYPYEQRNTNKKINDRVKPRDIGDLGNNGGICFWLTRSTFYLTQWKSHLVCVCFDYLYLPRWHLDLVLLSDEVTCLKQISTVARGKNFSLATSPGVHLFVKSQVVQRGADFYLATAQKQIRPIIILNKKNKIAD